MLDLNQRPRPSYERVLPGYTNTRYFWPEQTQDSLDIIPDSLFLLHSPMPYFQFEEQSFLKVLFHQQLASS